MNYPLIAAGKLRFPIQIVAQSRVQDAAGGLVPAQGVLVAEVWANIESALAMSRQVYEALQMTAEVTHIVTMRWQPGILANMDVLYVTGSPAMTRVFKIIAPVNPDERNHVLYLKCVERDDSAYSGYV